VGQPGRQGAERQQSLPLAYRLLHVPGAEEQALQQVHRHREPVVHQLGKPRRVQHEEPRPFGGAHGLEVDLLHPVAEIGVEGPGVHAGGRRPAYLDLVVTDPPAQRHRPGQQHIELLCGLALAVDTPRLHDLDLAVLAQPRKLVVGQLLEQEQAAQLLSAARRRGRAHSFSR
jgi:transposase